MALDLLLVVVEDFLGAELCLAAARAARPRRAAAAAPPGRPASLAQLVRRSPSDVPVRPRSAVCSELAVVLGLLLARTSASGGKATVQPRALERRSASRRGQQRAPTIPFSSRDRLRPPRARGRATRWSRSTLRPTADCGFGLPHSPARTATAAAGAARRRRARRRRGRRRMRRGRGRRRAVGRGAACSAAAPAPEPRALELLDPEQQRLQRQVGLRLHRLQQRQLELDARLGAVLDRATARRRAGRSRAAPRPAASRVGLRVQAVGVLGGDRERVGHLAERLHDEQVAQVRGQVAHELGDVAARRGQPLDREQRAPSGRARRAPRRSSSTARRRRRRGSRARRRACTSLAAVGDELLERAERVAEAAGGRAGDHADRRRRAPRSPPRPRHARSTLGDLLERRAGWKSKRWQRSTIVAGTLCASVVASTKTTCAGGSSSVFRNAFHAACESMCASSRM